MTPERHTDPDLPALLHTTPTGQGPVKVMF